MAAADDERSDPDAAARRGPGRDDHATDASARTEPSVMKNIERVADKVKGLLRPDG